MGVVTGWPGVGKTIAIHAFLLSLLHQPHTGLPPCVVIKVKPGSNSRQLVVDLLKSFGDNPRSLNANRFKMVDEAAEAILSNDLRASTFLLRSKRKCCKPSCQVDLSLLELRSDV